MGIFVRYYMENEATEDTLLFKAQLPSIPVVGQEVFFDKRIINKINRQMGSELDCVRYRIVRVVVVFTGESLTAHYKTNTNHQYVDSMRGVEVYLERVTKSNK